MQNTFNVFKEIKEEVKNTTKEQKLVRFDLADLGKSQTTPMMMKTNLMAIRNSSDCLHCRPDKAEERIVN